MHDKTIAELVHEIENNHCFDSLGILRDFLGDRADEGDKLRRDQLFYIDVEVGKLWQSGATLGEDYYRFREFCEILKAILWRDLMTWTEIKDELRRRFVPEVPESVATGPDNPPPGDGSGVDPIVTGTAEPGTAAPPSPSPLLWQHDPTKPLNRPTVNPDQDRADRFRGILFGGHVPGEHGHTLVMAVPDGFGGYTSASAVRPAPVGYQWVFVMRPETAASPLCFEGWAFTDEQAADAWARRRVWRAVTSRLYTLDKDGLVVMHPNERHFGGA